MIIFTMVVTNNSLCFYPHIEPVKPCNACIIGKVNHALDATELSYDNKCLLMKLLVL